MRSYGLTPAVSGGIAQGLGSTARSLLAAYGLMSSDPKVHRHRVELEPPFHPFHVPCPFTPERVETEVVAKLTYARKSVQSRVSYSTTRLWLSESDKPPDSAAIWRELGFTRGPASMLLAFGNENRIQQVMHVPAMYGQALTSILSSKLPHIQCEVETDGSILAGLCDHLRRLPSHLDHALLDVFLPPPFYRCLGTPGKGSVFDLVFAALRSIPPPAIGMVRVLFCTTTQPWGSLMGELVDYDEMTHALGHVPKEVLQAARDKAASAPTYAVSLWIAAFADKGDLEPLLHSLSVGFQSLRYGGRELGFLTGQDYGKLVRSRKGFVDALLSPYSYRGGSLLTPAELAHYWSFPSQDMLQDDDYPLLRTTATRRPRKATEPGLKLGFTAYAGTTVPVFQPARIRCQHTAIIGKPGKGKSVGLGMWALEMLEAGIGFAVIESHRCLIPWLLERLPRRHWQKVIYIDPMDRDHVLKFNILERESGQDIGKVADDRVSALRAQYTRSSWGPEIHRHMDYLIQTGLSVPGMRVADLPTLYEDSYRGEKLRDQALAKFKNPELIRYWQEDYSRTSRDQLARVISKISPYLRKEYIGRIFYEHANSLKFREIMDTGKILLADIPAGLIGGDSCNILCSTFASYFYDAALSRQNVREAERVEYGLLMDEYQRITTRDSEDALRESRKHKLALYVAFQQQAQMPDTVRTALANAGTLVAFDVGLDDAQTIFKEFYGEIPMKALMHKGERQAVCLMDGDIVSLSTYPAPKPLKRNYIREITENSRRLYYVPRSKAEYYKAVKRSRAEHKKRRGPRKPVFGRYDEVPE